jgi:hypothetical protein
MHEGVSEGHVITSNNARRCHMITSSYARGGSLPSFNLRKTGLPPLPPPLHPPTLRHPCVAPTLGEERERRREGEGEEEGGKREEGGGGREKKEEGETSKQGAGSVAGERSGQVAHAIRVPVVCKRAERHRCRFALRRGLCCGPRHGTCTRAADLVVLGRIVADAAAAVADHVVLGKGEGKEQTLRRMGETKGGEARRRVRGGRTPR